MTSRVRTALWALSYLIPSQSAARRVICTRCNRVAFVTHPTVAFVCAHCRRD